MNNLFPIKFQIHLQEQQNSDPINVPFTHQNECYVITQEDHRDINTTRIYTINKWNPCSNQNITNYPVNYCTNQLSDVIQYMMNALAYEQQKHTQNYVQQTANQPTSFYQHNLVNRLVDLEKNLFMQTNNHTIQTFHHDQNTSTEDLKYYQKSNQNQVRFFVDDVTYHSRGIQTDDDLLQGVKMNEIDKKEKDNETKYEMNNMGKSVDFMM